MKYNIGGKKYLTGQKSVVENSGDALWEALCDNLPGDVFTLQEAANVLESRFKYKARTAKSYANVILVNVLAQENPPLKKVGRRYAWA